MGAEVVERDGKRYFYVTGAYGLGIYDTSDPLLPKLVGRLVFPIDARDPGNIVELERRSERPVMRPGELLISTSESNINPTCSSAGALST